MNRLMASCLSTLVVVASAWADPVEGILHHGSLTPDQPEDHPGWYLLHPDQADRAVSVEQIEAPERFEGHYVRVVGESVDEVIVADSIALFPQGPRRTVEGVLQAPEQPHVEVYVGWRVLTADGNLYELNVGGFDLDGLDGSQVIAEITIGLGSETVGGVGEWIRAEHALLSLQAIEAHRIVAAMGSFSGELRLGPEPELWGSATPFPTLDLSEVETEGLDGEPVWVHGQTRDGLFAVSAIEPARRNLHWLMGDTEEFEGLPLAMVGRLHPPLPDARHSRPDWCLVFGQRGYTMNRFSQTTGDIYSWLDQPVLLHGHLEHSDGEVVLVVDDLQPLP